jgi:5-methylcytosine-specific restriction protein A
MATAPIYRSPEWKRVRLVVLARDRHLCQIKGPNCKGRATHVDHRIDWRDGGAWYDPANLRASCATCNIAQRNSRVAARARAYREGTGPNNLGHTSNRW